jgi:hypothetical protein
VTKIDEKIILNISLNKFQFSDETVHHIHTFVFGLTVDYYAWTIHHSVWKVSSIYHSIFVINVAQSLIHSFRHFTLIFLDVTAFWILDYALAVLWTSIKNALIYSFICIYIQSTSVHFSLAKLSIVIVSICKLYVAFSLKIVIKKFSFIFKIIRLINSFPMTRAFEKLPFVWIIVFMKVFSSSVNISLRKITFYFLPRCDIFKRTFSSNYRSSNKISTDFI